MEDLLSGLAMTCRDRPSRRLLIRHHTAVRSMFLSRGCHISAQPWWKTRRLVCSKCQWSRSFIKGRPCSGLTKSDVGGNPFLDTCRGFSLLTPPLRLTARWEIVFSTGKRRWGALSEKTGVVSGGSEICTLPGVGFDAGGSLNEDEHWALQCR